MTMTIKLVLIATIAGVGISAPAFAQTGSHDRVIAAHQIHRTKMSTDQNGYRAFDMVPSSAYDPALNGGGSAGYNQSLHDDHW